MDNSSLGSSFDLASQNGVMLVLLAIRQSGLTSEQKSEMRDLVFLYANNGGDSNLRVELEKKIAQYDLKPVVQQVNKEDPQAAPKEEPASISPIGAVRPEPTFVNSPVSVIAPAPTTTPMVDEKPAVKDVPVVDIPKISVAAPVHEEVRESVVVDLTPATIAPTAVTQTQTTVPPEVGTMAPEPVAEKPVIPNTPFPDVDQNYLNRIREIKAAVNGKVGNPVNLVDIDNVVGREYMNALLDAMKRLSGGVGQVEPAMQRLEAAFLAVEKAIELHEVKNELEEVENATADKISAEISKEVSKKINEPASGFTDSKAVESVVEDSLPAAELVKHVESKVIEKSDNTEVVVERVKPIIPESEPVSVVVSSNPIAPIQNTQNTAVSTASVVPSILEATPIHTPNDLPTAESLATGDLKDPLYTREIDDGLEQLLSDWVLFKKSGLFGSGPKGREHPLYKKLSSLPIPHLLAGRFEGSTQDIKQSITDYMNGWRYEQGIIYQQEETFEHYLRRVIKQILDLQKKRRNA